MGSLHLPLLFDIFDTHLVFCNTGDTNIEISVVMGFITTQIMRAMKSFPWSWAKLKLYGVFQGNQFDAMLIGNHTVLNGGLVNKCSQM